MRNRCCYWACLPASSPGEYPALGKLAEGEELGSNLLRTFDRTGPRQIVSTASSDHLPPNWLGPAASVQTRKSARPSVLGHRPWFSA